MTNTLVGDVYQKIIEEVVGASRSDFEESGVGSQTLSELQQEWQAKLSGRGVAQMPWDPKPQPAPQPPPAQSSSLPSAPNGLPGNPYGSYDQTAANGQRIKAEPGTDQQFHGLPNGGYQQNSAQQGGAARAAQLLQQQYGNSANASVNAMQRSGLALPGQQQKPQGLQLPTNPAQHNYQQQQQAAMAARQQQMQQQQQQGQPRVKVESNESPRMNQGSFQPQQQQQQQQQPPNYTQTDGADDQDDDDLRQWRAMLAERRAISAEQTQKADRLMRDQVMRLSADLQSGLMLPLNEQPKSRQKRPKLRTVASSSTAPSIPQLDGDVDDDEEKLDIKDEDDADAINSDLDDSDEEGAGAMGDDDDEFGDSILCTYDKVQRVKNKWKCTLKDGVMSVNGKEWVFHKGMGEFEW